MSPVAGPAGSVASLAAVFRNRYSPPAAQVAAVALAQEELPAFEAVLSAAGLRPDQVCAVGDDLFENGGNFLEMLRDGAS